MASRDSLPRQILRIACLFLITLVAALVLMVAPGPAGATPPALVSVTQSGGFLTATWTLEPGKVSYSLVVGAQNTPHDFFGLFSARYRWDALTGLDPSATTFTSPRQLDPGTWYVRVASADSPDFFSDKEWSNILSVTIKPVCSDGVDNDGDGKTDHPADPGCFTADESNEADPPAAPSPTGPTGVSVATRRVDGISRVRRRGVTVGIACPQACQASSRLLLVSRRPAAAAAVLGRGSQSLSGSGYATLRVPLSARGKRALAGATSAKVHVVTSVAGGSFTRSLRLVRSAPQNGPPEFPGSMQTTRESRFVYDDSGRLYGGYTALTVTSLATDADGDPLTYSWTGSSGEILRANGPSVVWTRTMDVGQFRAGTLTLTVSDGRGGSDSFAFVFQRGAA